VRGAKKDNGMEKVTLQASRRSVIGKKVGALRRQGVLPGVIYGRNREPINISMDLHQVSQKLVGASQSSLINIDLEGETLSTLIREKQMDYVKRQMIHIDFQAVSLTEKLRTAVNLELFGVSPAVKDFNGILVSNLFEVEVECFPQDLPENIPVDISVLKKIGDSILVKDLKVSENVEILTNPDEVVAVVSFQGEEEEAPEGETVAAEPEVIERGKKVEEEV
jgi:large subunit ribosomal protein L25